MQLDDLTDAQRQQLADYARRQTQLEQEIQRLKADRDAYETDLDAYVRLGEKHGVTFEFHEDGDVSDVELQRRLDELAQWSSNRAERRAIQKRLGKRLGQRRKR